MCEEEEGVSDAMDDYDPIWPSEPDYTRYAEHIEGIPESMCCDDRLPDFFYAIAYNCPCRYDLVTFCLDCEESFAVPLETPYDNEGLTAATRSRTKEHKKPPRKKAAILHTRQRLRDRTLRRRACVPDSNDDCIEPVESAPPAQG